MPAVALNPGALNPGEPSVSDEDALALARGILESATQCIVVTDPSGIIRQANRGAERLSGYPRARLVGRDITTLVHEPRALLVPAHFAALVAEASQGLPHESEWTYLHCDGSRSPVALSVTALRDDQAQVSGYLFMASDISDHKSAERDLLIAKEHAESAARAKSDFLARMSHEIRTPMNSVIGLTDLALQTRLSGEQRDYLQTASIAAKMLLHIINDILDFSRVEAGQLALDRIELRLRQCLGDALRGLSQQAADKGLELVLLVPAAVPDALIGDPYRLQQVIVNLVGNALKFTEKGEVVVSVSVVYHHEREVGLSFAVSDSGPGVPAERQAAIFEAFTQADDDVRRKFGGSGLGLAICSQLVAMMRGRLRLESQPGKGSTFTAEVAFGLGPEPTEPGPRVAGRAVLVVEDHRATRQMLCDVFTGWNMVVVAAEGAAHAEALMKRHLRAGRRFDLIVLDTTLPDDDGVRLRRSLAVQNDGAAWLLLVPGQARPRRELTQPVPGARWFVRVSKPVLLAELSDAVQTLLGAAPRDLPSSVQVPDTTPSARALRILVAEDNLMNQKVVQAILRSHAHDVATVSSGRMALERLARETFDLVLMDVEMPKMDGLEATRRWRTRERERGLQRTPMVALTAQAMTGDRERCLAAGLDAYLSKPLDAAELQSTIAGLTGVVSGVVSGVPSGMPSAEPTPASPAGAPQEEAAPFDRQALRRRWGNDPAAFAEIGALFRSNAGRLLKELSPQVKEHDPRARRTLHQLKGMLLNLSAKEAVACARKVEHACKEGSWDAASFHHDLEKLYRQVKRVEEALNEQGA